MIAFPAGNPVSARELLTKYRRFTCFGLPVYAVLCDIFDSRAPIGELNLNHPHHDDRDAFVSESAGFFQMHTFVASRGFSDRACASA
ncbi:hypothetical protein RRSWK_06936 [Rhodopirellula sp. SWK7]|nr:hypothetical protein RRSWK_06936 [Rhodopirellula sp. SWK7]